ncbi:M3 family oligoendopeptidase [Patescibacteria group bacterium]|nr:M3 family oligoendopeptidase [Patescibacteria group bacterium]MBU4057229.1 M3 family oligoendopeptidase [Patescibacteria group bacterium]MBU4368339.1 M3 family oligoendopeptidase [Patescibacteria group bacterium]
MPIKIKQTTWNLKPLFKSDNDPAMAEARKIVERESYKFINKWRDRADYLENPAVLRQALDEYENWLKFYGTDGKEGNYFHLRASQDQNSSKLKAKFNQVQEFSNKILNDIQFFLLRVSRIDIELQKKFLEFEGLKDYKHFLEKIFSESKYLLSEPEEKIMNLKVLPAYINWVNMTEGFLAKEEREVLGIDGKKAKKNFSEILNLTSDKKRRVRDAAATAVNDIFRKNADVAEAEMNSVMADKKINDELRRFPRPDSAMHLSDDIASEVSDALVGAASARFNISKRYYRLKAKLFGVKKLKYHERSVEYGKIDKKYSYQEAVDFAHDVFEKTDKEFTDIFKKFILNGQIDVFPRKGKSGGAFCSQRSMTQPTYILMNFTGRMRDVFTIAHESGHGINNELMRKKQNALNFGITLFTAEMSSKLMESFAFEEMLKETSGEARLAIMMMILDDDIGHIFSTAARNIFEREMHEEFRRKGYLSKEEIGGLFKKHGQRYMGSAVEQSLGAENWWMHITHLRVFFYNYQYAAGILVAKFFAKSARKNPEFIVKIKEFLSAGISDSPQNLLKNMGIDITGKEFWNKGIDEVENLLDETEKLAKKLGKI